MHKDFFIHIIKHKPELFQAILRFNASCLPTTIPPIPGALQALPEENAKALWQALLEKNNLFQRFGFQHQVSSFWDFTEESRRLVLVEPDAMEQAIQMFGAAIHAEQIAQVIGKDDVLALRTHITPQILAYALQRGRYQLGTVARIFRSLDTVLPLHQRIILHGRLAVQLCIAPWPEALRTMCSSWIHQVLDANPDSMDASDSLFLEKDNLGHLVENTRKIWFSFKKILLKEVVPQWAPYFE